MSKGKSLADLTSRVDEAASARPLPPAPAAVAPPAWPAAPAPDLIRRYTAELPDSLHLRLRHFIIDEHATAYAVNKALVTLLVTDETIAERVRQLLRQ